VSLRPEWDGHVKEIHPVTSLSPGLDKAAIDTVRSWKFKGCQDEPLCNDGNFKTHLKDLRVQSVFRAMCHPRYWSDVKPGRKTAAYMPDKKGRSRRSRIHRAS
jgi:hypothetical protein